MGKKKRQKAEAKGNRISSRRKNGLSPTLNNTCPDRKKKEKVELCVCQCSVRHIS